eukprot:6949646-Lingulodinium_polyedra.AAC.1
MQRPSCNGRERSGWQALTLPRPFQAGAVWVARWQHGRLPQRPAQPPGARSRARLQHLTFP